jgi:gamma-glutamyltranspeptidase/glutathione hydrolase
MTMRSADGDIKFINFREYAPALARDGYWWPVYKNEETGRWQVVGNANMTGGRSIGVPGTVAGMAYAVEKYGSGKKTLKELIQPAVDLAENGFWMGPTTSGCLGDNYNALLNYPEFGSVFLIDDETTEKLEREQNRYYTGDKFTNPQQAKALKMIQDEGITAFYDGLLSEAMIKTANKYGGTFLDTDFRDYEAKEKEPVRGTFMGKQIISSPLPSSGGTAICQILNIMEAYGIDKLKEYGHNSAEYIHVLSEAMKMAYADRSKYLYDYGEETELERATMDALTSKEYAAFLASLIKDDAVLAPESHDPFEYEHQDTVSYSVADIEGNIVTVTFTVNGIFGSKVVPEGYGFILNNEMGDFSSDPNSVNAIAPFKYPLSSMSPTIVLNEDGTPFMTVGSPGGATIIAAVTNCILNVVLFGMEAQEAVNAPRAWDNTSNRINYENRIPKDVIDKLTKLGHEVNDSGEWPAGAGSNQVIVYDADGKLHAAADPRRDCKAWAF